MQEQDPDASDESSTYISSCINWGEFVIVSGRRSQASI